MSALATSSFVGDAAALRRSSSAAHASTQRVVLTVEAKESRIGKASIKVPKGVTVSLKDNHMIAKARRVRAGDAARFPACSRADGDNRAPRASFLCSWIRS